MTEFLKVLELAQNHRVAQVDVGCRGIDAEISAQLFAGLRALLELREQVFSANRLLRTFGQVCELFVNGHGIDFVPESMI